ncbi:A/G-specific adenine glycosylase [Reichenbachiella carrageenanivorans]|uniref:Adenine DNA glycosylase n=1 Tax=Reichenbachiella carrageenanivorans TaxID=2979869 RepID=A0ABY6D5F0_9BACT|nr:A/G-specific adenine glycosylase [Reichenbachiella carrageenanivorans]UXX80278.1 A/G-specific adenine glycosylase [Reichenbachiella carrageenanivorans]
MRNISRPLKTGKSLGNDDWFSSQLLDWYGFNKRHLPWRETKDPFKIWLSEIILQQTRVNQGMPYYLKFIASYQTVQDFAQANLDDILKLWQGLGYYSRARNMHQCANAVMNHFGGNFPDNYAELQKLKGIGKYTAAAIASICFGEAVPTVDGNVFRVMARLFGIAEDIAKTSTFKVFFDRAKTLMPAGHSGDFNQAMMEFGAMICTPKSPECATCMFETHCFAKSKGLIDSLPVKSKNVKVRHRYFNYYVYTHEGQVLIRQRSEGDIWTGLFEFDIEETKKSLKSSSFEGGKLEYSSSEMVHQLTHQKLHLRFHVYEMRSQKALVQVGEAKQMLMVSRERIGDYAVPKPIELFLNNEFCR